MVMAQDNRKSIMTVLLFVLIFARATVAGKTQLILLAIYTVESVIKSTCVKGLLFHTLRSIFLTAI